MHTDIFLIDYTHLTSMKCEFDMFILENQRIIIASIFSTCGGGVNVIFMIMSEWKKVIR